MKTTMTAVQSRSSWLLDFANSGHIDLLNFATSYCVCFFISVNKEGKQMTYFAPVTIEWPKRSRVVPSSGISIRTSDTAVF